MQLTSAATGSSKILHFDHTCSWQINAFGLSHDVPETGLFFFFLLAESFRLHAVLRAVWFLQTFARKEIRAKKAEVLYAHTQCYTQLDFFKKVGLIMRMLPVKNEFGLSCNEP